MNVDSVQMLQEISVFRIVSSLILEHVHVLREDRLACLNGCRTKSKPSPESEVVVIRIESNLQKILIIKIVHDNIVICVYAGSLGVYSLYSTPIAEEGVFKGGVTKLGTREREDREKKEER